MTREEFIGNQIARIKKKLGKTMLVAVSKYYPVTDIQLAYNQGQRDFGESRVQELQDKAKALQTLADLNWHFIGHLQSKKVRSLFKVEKLKFIHSVDSMKLLMEIYKNADLLGPRKLGLFLQVNTSGEQEKHGFQDIPILKEAISFMMNQNHPCLFLTGLMTMGKIRTDDFENDARSCFQKLLNLRNEFEPELSGQSLLLSMGMTDDYNIALSYNTDYVRIGSAIFSFD